MSDKKCPNCGACKECGAHPPQVIPMPYPQPYPVYPRPYNPQPWINPWPNRWTYTSGSSQMPTSGGYRNISASSSMH